MRNALRVWIGWDAKEAWAYQVAERSLRAHASQTIHTRPICMDALPELYRRETERRDGRWWDVISDAPMSTEHAIARFFVPFLCHYQGWALFVDGDVLFRTDVAQLYALADHRYAVQVVQHPPLLETGLKKDGAAQVLYDRKNWSSVMLFNCAHPANRRLDPALLNTWPGRDLHAFRWLQDEEIGALPARWNHLVGVSEACDNPAVVHFTLGVPDLPGHEQDAFADEWFAVAHTAGYPRSA